MYTCVLIAFNYNDRCHYKSKVFTTFLMCMIKCYIIISALYFVAFLHHTIGKIQSSHNLIVEQFRSISLITPASSGVWPAYTGPWEPKYFTMYPTSNTSLASNCSLASFEAWFEAITSHPSYQSSQIDHGASRVDCRKEVTTAMRPYANLPPIYCATLTVAK